ncbi:MBL fold metallo-hydrolase [Thermicanus aegyptius]|uniref:MBL fold metallo-hydrolase n=1 Tax=Thermicanus aegyptius TaxID=94009 RepID=UPI0003FEDFA1|nr:MBL fold metallo-hydrolase [Thermicanus aegyptius]
MRYSILASGSSGNSFFVRTGKTRLLTDVGLSCKRIEKLLIGIDEDPSQLDGILITHEHIDHVRGLRVFAKKYQIPIYMSHGTWKALSPQLEDLDPKRIIIFPTGERHTFNDLTVESFPVSHDAAEPMGFIFKEGEKKISYVTDLGYVSDRIKGKIADSHVFIMEANHDVEMLRMGSYPWNVKQRILGDTGHLSNETSAEALTEVISQNTERIYLAHLSKENNLIELARMTVTQILLEEGHPVGEKIRVYDTYPDQATIPHEI